MSTDAIIHVLLTTMLPSVVVSFITGWFLRKTTYAALAVCSGIVIGNVVSRLLPWWPSEQEMSLLLLMVSLSFLLIDVKPRHWWVALLFVYAFSSVLVQAEIRAFMHGESFLEMAYYSVYCLIAFLLYLGLTRAERTLSGRVMLVLYSLWGLAASIILIHAHSGLLSQCALLWTCSCVGLYLVYCQRIEPIRGLAGPSTLYLPYLLNYGLQTCYSRVPAVTFVLSIIAPLSCLLLFRQSTSPRLRFIAVLGWLLLLVIACGLAIYFEDVLVF